MDKYDVIFVIETIFNNIKLFFKNRKGFKKRYYAAKFNWISMKYYQLRTKRSSKYYQKHEMDVRSTIEKTFTLDKNQKYSWQMSAPIKEGKSEK